MSGRNKADAWSETVGEEERRQKPRQRVETEERALEEFPECVLSEFEREDWGEEREGQGEAAAQNSNEHSLFDFHSLISTNPEYGPLLSRLLILPLLIP